MPESRRKNEFAPFCPGSGNSDHHTTKLTNHRPIHRRGPRSGLDGSVPQAYAGWVMATAFQNILLVSPNWLGDVIMALPAFQAWKASEGADCRVTVLARGALSDLWALHEGVAATLKAPAPGADTHELLATLRARAFDAAYVLPNSVRSAWLPFRAGIPSRLGYPGHFPRRWLLTEVHAPAVPPPTTPLAPHQAWEAYGLWLPGRPLPAQLDAPRLSPLPTDLADIRARLADAPPPFREAPRFLALVPGAARGDSKQWPPARYVEAATLLHRSHRAAALLLGTPGEKPLCDQIAAALADAAVPVLSLAGQTSLPQMAAALALADGVLCNDSGGMHLAAALGRPVVAVFGITDPEKTGPLGPSAHVLQDSPIRSRKVPRSSPVATAALLRITAQQAADVMAECWTAVPEKSKIS